LNSRVYFNRPNNLKDLRQRLRVEMEQINPDIIKRSVQNLHTRVGRCEMVGWRQFQHLPYLNFIVNLKCLFFFEVNKKCISMY
jgi:hypothetical protein